jgi:hypothetical protein
MDKEYRINVILDLDNTIINALASEDRQKLPSHISDKFNYADYSPFFYIYERPHLQLFLDWLFENCNVSVFTAAEKDYALFIIENIILIKPGRKLDFIFYREHVEQGEKEYEDTMKDLRLVWDFYKVPNFYPSNTVIIDDLDLVCQTNPKNCIRIPGFFIVDEETHEPNYESVDDEELLHMIFELDKLSQKYRSTINKFSYDHHLLDL